MEHLAALVRAAHAEPRLRPALVLLIQKAAWNRTYPRRGPATPTPTDGDMDKFLDWAEGYFRSLHPGMDGALGLDFNDRGLKTRSRISGDKGSLEYTHPSDMKVIVTFQGDAVTVTGEIKGQALNKKFPWRAPYSGIHGGSFSDVLHYIEDSLPQAKVVYVVVGDGSPQKFDSKEALTRKYRQTGTTSFGGLRRKELSGQPELEGLAGPMYNGRKGDVIELRYETWAAHDILSR
jgi:hypothetical protein